MADSEQNVYNEDITENKEETEKDTQEDVSLNASEDKENEDKKNNEIKNAEQTTEAKQTEQKMETQGGKVHLRPLKSHYKTFAKTTLPHVLTEYGLEDKEHPPQKKKEKVKKKKRREQFYDEEEELRQQRKAREEKFRQNYGDNRTTNQYYAEYLDFIERKVIAQRLKLQKEREEEEKKEKERQEEERRKLKFQRRSDNVPLKHDDEYLQNLPKTDLFRIVELQDRMKREGKLKTQSDVDKFWREISQPDVFYSQFKVKRSAEPIREPHKTEEQSPKSRRSRPSQPLQDQPSRPLSHISESSKTEQPWAITQQYQSTHGARSTSGEKSRKTGPRDASLDLERRCPKLEMPTLACFSLHLGEKPPDPEDIRRKVELKAREKNRKKFQRKLRKMHQLAMANAAVANRLLAQRGDLTELLEGGTLRDLLAVYDEPESAARYPAEMTRAIEVYPVEESVPSSASTVSRPSSHKSSTSSHRLTPLGSETSSRAGSEKSRRKKKSSVEMIEYPTPLPLTYNEVVGSAKVMEAKCLSTNWINYMHAGKSVFAPT